MGITKDDMEWHEVVSTESGKHAISVGGFNTLLELDYWPHFNGKPLRYFGTVIDAGTPMYLFLGDTEDSSWQAEDGGNCVLVDGGEWPEWVEVKSVTEPVLFSDRCFATDDERTEPKWLQGEETPEGFEYVAQIPSQVDGGEVINIGEGYGTAYVFWSHDGSKARMVWQS